MNLYIDSCNHTEFEGRVVDIHEYSKDKAANITISVESRLKNGSVKSVNIQTKCFTPAIYNNTRTGMLVRLFGHVAPGSYQKNGQTVYTQDLITDYIQFMESKSVVEAREAAKFMRYNPNAIELGE